MSRIRDIRPRVKIVMSRIRDIRPRVKYVMSRIRDYRPMSVNHMFRNTFTLRDN